MSTTNTTLDLNTLTADTLDTILKAIINNSNSNSNNQGFLVLPFNIEALKVAIESQIETPTSVATASVAVPMQEKNDDNKYDDEEDNYDDDEYVTLPIEIEGGLSYETFNTSLELGDKTAEIINRVLTDFGIELYVIAGYKKCRSVRKLSQIVNEYGESGLRFALQLIEDAGWSNHEKAYTENGLNVGFYAYPECLKKNGQLHKTKYKLLIHELKRYTVVEYADLAKKLFAITKTITVHPEDCIQKLVQRDLAYVQAQNEKICAYHKNYYRQYIKVQ